MKHSHKAAYLLGGAAVAGIIGMVGQSASAHMKNSADLASDLATKLNVPADSVKTALDTIDTEREATMQAERKTDYTTKLTEAVTAGKLTEEQKQKLLTKYDEIQTKQAEIRKQQDALINESEQWAKDNGIDSTYLMPDKGGRGMHGGPGRR